jgi:ribose transport system substrate-binding protein
VNEATGEERPEEVVAQIRDSATALASGKLTADWIAVDSEGSAKVLLVDVPSYPVLVPYATAMKDELGAVCAACSVTTINVSLADIGTNLPNAVVSALQRDPELKYVVFGFGDMTIGLEPALLAAGIQDQATLVGQMPGVENIQNLRDGANGAWVAHISAESGWRAVDAFARAFAGDDPTIVEGLPAMQILTKDNVADANFTEDGYWLPSADLSDQFLAMWNVK